MWFCFLALRSLSSLSLSVSAISSHALSLLSSSHLLPVLLLPLWPLVWGTSLRLSLSSVHLLSSAVVPVWDEFLWRDGGGHRAQVSQTQRKVVWKVCRRGCVIVRQLAGDVQTSHFLCVCAYVYRFSACDWAPGCIFAWKLGRLLP